MRGAAARATAYTAGMTTTRFVQINVDVQNDFCPGGSLGVQEGDQVVAPLNALARSVRAAGGMVIHTGDFHPPQTSHFDTWPVHCVVDTPGSDLHAALDVQPADPLIRKGTGANDDAYSGFDGQDAAGRSLAEVLGPGPVTVFVGGLATDYCVKATVLDALKQPGVTAYAVTDAMRAVNVQPGDGDAAIAQMVAAGARPITSAEAARLVESSQHRGA